MRIIAAQAERHDTAALAHMLPPAIDAVEAPSTFSRSTDFLYRMTRVLAMAGLQEQARHPYERLRAMAGQQAGKADLALNAWQLAELQVWMGDLQGALATARGAGALSRPGNAAQMAVGLG